MAQFQQRSHTSPGLTCQGEHYPAIDSAKRHAAVKSNCPAYYHRGYDGTHKTAVVAGKWRSRHRINPPRKRYRSELKAKSPAAPCFIVLSRETPPASVLNPTPQQRQAFRQNMHANVFSGNDSRSPSWYSATATRPGKPSRQSLKHRATPPRGNIFLNIMNFIAVNRSR